VQGRMALGSRAGARVRRLGDARDTATLTSRGPRQAHLDGFDLHANVWVSANDRAGVERLCRYVLRPPFAQERLRLRGDGRVALELKRVWHDGTRELVFEPLEFLERLAAMTPRPETNLLICHGVLAPRARWRARVVVYGRRVPEPTASTAPLAAGPDGTGVKAASPRAWSWAALMHRGVRYRRVGVCPLWGPPTPDHHRGTIPRSSGRSSCTSRSATRGRVPAPPHPNPAPPRPDRTGSGARRTPSCLRSEGPSALIRPVRRPVDGGGVSGIACRSPGPARSTCEEPANVRCAVGSWGGRRPSPGDYVTGTGATSGATASGGRSC